VGKTSQVKLDGERYDFKPLSETSKKRLDLNNLLIRAKEEEKRSKKLNLSIVSGATVVVLVFLMLISL
tara:strand:- start:154 stop:357 length:204 start_codon:yes stop_codon:yes gene_type:complete